MPTNFIPKRRELSAVTNATRAQVTTTEAHGYEEGQFIRLIVPKIYGLHLDYVKAKILSIDSTTQFTTDLDTSSLKTYTTPPTPDSTNPAFTQSHCVPISGVEDNDVSIA
jgi:hypothetical protein